MIRTELVHDFREPLSKYIKEEVSSEERYSSNIGLYAGDYFEGQVYYYLSKISGKKAEEPQNRNYLKAKNILSNPEGRYIMIKGKDKQQYKYDTSDIQKLMKVIQQVAQETARNFYETIKGEIENKNFEIDLVGGGGNLEGDIELIIEGKKIILELKFQISQTAVRWFELKEKTLFNGGFKEFLEKNRNEYWNYKKSPQSWINTTRQQAMMAYLGELWKGDAAAIWKYILSKCEGIDSKIDKKYIGWAKSNVDGTSSTVLANLNELTPLSNVKMSPGQNASLDFLYQDKPIGNFGMTDFLGPNYEIKKIKKDDGTITKKKVKKENYQGDYGPMDSDFTFAAYIAQRKFAP